MKKYIMCATFVFASVFSFASSEPAPLITTEPTATSQPSAWDSFCSVITDIGLGLMGFPQ